MDARRRSDCPIKRCTSNSMWLRTYAMTLCSTSPVKRCSTGRRNHQLHACAGWQTCTFSPPCRRWSTRRWTFAARLSTASWSSNSEWYRNIIVHYPLLIVNFKSWTMNDVVCEPCCLEFLIVQRFSKFQFMAGAKVRTEKEVGKYLWYQLCSRWSRREQLLLSRAWSRVGVHAAFPHGHTARYDQ